MTTVYKKKFSDKIQSDGQKHNYPVLFFAAPGEWRKWLEHNHAAETGVWLRFYKKNSGVPSLNYSGALDEALCFGWIDGQAKKYDEHSYLQKFTPRKSGSIWSKRNIEHVTRLEKEGKMTPFGMKVVETAKANGRWEMAYDSPQNMKIPEDFLVELSKDPKAFAFFEKLNRTNKYAVAWRLQTARKPETREKRIKSILEMLSREEKFH